jgi:hypothetical protein
MIISLVFQPLKGYFDLNLPYKNNKNNSLATKEVLDSFKRLESTLLRLAFTNSLCEFETTPLFTFLLRFSAPVYIALASLHLTLITSLLFALSTCIAFRKDENRLLFEGTLGSSLFLGTFEFILVLLTIYTIIFSKKRSGIVRMYKKSAMIDEILSTENFELMDSGVFWVSYFNHKSFKWEIGLEKFQYEGDTSESYRSHAKIQFDPKQNEDNLDQEKKAKNTGQIQKQKEMKNENPEADFNQVVWVKIPNKDSQQTIGLESPIKIHVK